MIRDSCNFLDFDISIEDTEIEFEISSFDGIKDVTINGQSIVNNDNVAELTLGAGLAYTNSELTLSVGDTPEIVPKELTLGEQENVQLLVIDNGVVKHSNLNNLDYSKLTITNDLSQVRIGDYLFKVNNNRRNFYA